MRLCLQPLRMPLHPSCLIVPSYQGSLKHYSLRVLLHIISHPVCRLNVGRLAQKILHSQHSTSFATTNCSMIRVHQQWKHFGSRGTSCFWHETPAHSGGQRPSLGGIMRPFPAFVGRGNDGYQLWQYVATDATGRSFEDIMSPHEPTKN